ncbi:MAG: Protein of unknown function DUF1573 [Verrucomicrobia bacterium]|jgi:hypothetical protein|nr:MAG: Protein of unknown function DUF1573 [Verrucomicrobiota bacterium]
MQKAAVRLVVVSSFAFLPFVADAAFQFEQTLVEVTPDFGQERVTAVFRFKNEGTAGTVRSIETSCGCLSANSDKRSYAAGEGGEVTAVFNVKGLSGSVERSITFVSGAKGEAPVRLAVRVHVPALVEIEPKMLNWELGEAPLPKVFKITMQGPDPVHIKSASSSRRNVSTSVRTLADGRSYEIEVKPENTGEALLGMVRIETDSRFREHQKQMAFFRIDKKQASVQP